MKYPLITVILRRTCSFWFPHIQSTFFIFLAPCPNLYKLSEYILELICQVIIRAHTIVLFTCFKCAWKVLLIGKHCTSKSQSQNTGKALSRQEFLHNCAALDSTRCCFMSPLTAMQHFSLKCFYSFEPFLLTPVFLPSLLHSFLPFLVCSSPPSFFHACMSAYWEGGAWSCSSLGGAWWHHVAPGTEGSASPGGTFCHTWALKFICNELFLTHGGRGGTNTVF